MGIYKPADRKSYYAKVNGKRVCLKTGNRKEAQKRWAELIASSEQDTSPSQVTVRHLLKSYFEWLKVNRSEQTWSKREYVYKRFSREYGDLKVSQIRNHHVTRWAIAHWGDKSDTTRHDQMQRIQTAFNWGIKQGLLEDHKLKQLEKPQRQVRENFVKPEDWGQLLEACTPSEFRKLVQFTLLTGIRPQESRIVEAKHVFDSRIVFEIKNSKGKKRNRVIHLNEMAKSIIDGLVKAHPNGPLFRNSNTEPWTRYALNCAMKRAKKKTSWEWLNMTILRHSFAHCQVKAGTDSLILQQLMGHMDGRMLARVYSHASEATDNIQAAANVTSQAIPK